MVRNIVSESVRIEKIIERLNKKTEEYKKLILIENETDNAMSSYTYIKTIEYILRNKKIKDDISYIVKNCLRELMLEKPTSNIDYFINLMLINKKENLLYKSISHLFSTSLVGANIKNEQKLIESIIYIGDKYLFIECNRTQAIKWYDLVKNKKFHIENNRVRSEILELNNQGFFKYSIANNPEKKEVQLFIAILSNNINITNDDVPIECIKLVYDYYFLIKNKLEDFKEARMVFMQLLIIINNTIFTIIKETKNRILSNNIKQILVDMFCMSYDNDFVPYISYVKGETEETYKSIVLIAKSIEKILTIKKQLLVKKDEKIEVAYYTNMNSFSFMLPYKNKDSKPGMLPLMNISYMNDPTEGTVLFKYLNIAKKENQREIANFPYIYIKSFTSLIDYLPMWGMYANEGKGICVVLDWKKIRNQKCELYRICYVNVRGEKKPEIKPEKNNKNIDTNIIAECLDELKEIRKSLGARVQGVFDLSLRKIAYLFKDGHYYSEDETRLLITATNYDKSTHITIKERNDIDINNCPYLYKYADFIPYIKEIIIGPKFNNIDYNFPFIKSQIEKMCEATNSKMPKITYSDIDYR